jgi:hypothetical protein
MNGTQRVSATAALPVGLIVIITHLFGRGKGRLATEQKMSMFVCVARVKRLAHYGAFKALA